MDYALPEEEKNSINEPTPVYNGKTGKKLRIFSSFQEQEGEMIMYWAAITPLQRLAHLYEMVKVSFRLTEEDARNLQQSRKIRIIKYEP